MINDLILIWLMAQRAMPAINRESKNNLNPSFEGEESADLIKNPQFFLKDYFELPERESPRPLK